jgi:hypothetical protein
MIRVVLASLSVLVASAAWSKLPPPVLDEAAKAKAAETAAKTAYQAKMDAYLLCKAQDKVAAVYRKTSGTTAARKDKAAAPMPVPTPTTASQGGSTPTPAMAAAPAIPPCADPGPFAYAPPAEKPLETSGAHSPAPTAASPPSVKTPSADMAPAQPTKPAAKKS